MDTGRAGRTSRHRFESNSGFLSILCCKLKESFVDSSEESAIQRHKESKEGSSEGLVYFILVSYLYVCVYVCIYYDLLNINTSNTCNYTFTPLVVLDNFCSILS